MLGLVFSAPCARAGDGTISTATQTLDLKVLFAFSETDENIAGPNNPESWRSIFNDASSRLWNATNGQLKIGTVTVYRRALSRKDDADVWILPGNGTAYSNGVAKLGVPGYHTSLYGKRHRSNNAAFRGGFSLAHELSHYVLGLYDQYQGAYVPLAKKNSWTSSDLGPIQRIPFSVAGNLMAGGGGVGNTATEFDSATDVNKGSAVGNRWWMTENWIMNGKSSWETLAEFKWNGEHVFPNVPTAADTVLPAGDTDVVWEVLPDVARLSVVIDRSGSMSAENRMALAKLGAGFMVGLTVDRHVVSNFVNGVTDTVVYPADHLSVIDFDSSVTELLPITVVDGAGVVRSDAKQAIASLAPRGGTAIGHGVQKAVEVFAADTPSGPGAQENIVVLSDGADNSSRVTSMTQAAANAANRGAKIYTIALGNSADVTGLNDMANATGGKFFQASDGFGLLDIYSKIYGEIRGGGLMESLASLLFENSTSDSVFPVDELSDSATFSMASPEAGFTVQLTSPTGKRFTESSAADGVVLQKDDNTVVFRVTKPAKGNWKLSVTSPKTTTGSNYRYNVMANANSAVVSVAPTVQVNTVYPQPILVTCPVTALSPVAGASVTADVTGPNGSLGSMQLFDDGASIHGDKIAGDGVYSGYYGAYSKSGIYSFAVRVVNVNGRAATGGGENSLTPTAPTPIPPFTRVAYATATVTGVPEQLSPDWLRVDALSLNKATNTAANGVLQLRCTFNTPKSSLMLGSGSLTVSLDSKKIVIGANNVRPSRVPGVFTITDPTQGVTGSIVSSIGGTSKNQLLLTATKFPVDTFDFDQQTAVEVANGAFTQQANLANRTSTNRRSIAYVSSSNFSSDAALHLDGLRAVISPKQNKTDSLRVVATYQGSSTYNPAADDLLLRVGQFTIPVAKGSLKTTSPQKFAGVVTVGGSPVSVNVDGQRRIVTVNGSAMNLGTQVLQTSEVQLKIGAFDDTCTVTTRATRSGLNTVLNY
jgi:hypothetical protein